MTQPALDDRELDRLCVALANMLANWWAKHEEGMEPDTPELMGFEREAA